MRWAEPMSRVVAAGYVLLHVGAIPAVAETHRGEPDLRDRVFFDRTAGPLPSADDRRIVPLPEARLPHDAVKDLLPIAARRGVPMVLAALSPPRDGALLDSSMPPWAVPRPPTRPSSQSETIDKRRAIADAPLPRLPERPLCSFPEHPRLGTLWFGRRRLFSACDRPIMSRLPDVSSLSVHEGAPLAALEPDQDEHRVPARGKAPEFIMPFANGRVTSLFNQGRRHPAIDLAGALGSPVLATTMRQTVVFAGWRGGYGNAVITRDPSGRLHLYGHLNSITSRVGQLLDQGVKLGHLGSTGHSTGPHVHYEVRDSKGRHINPVTLLFPGRAVAKGLAWHGVRLEPRAIAVAANQPRPR
jgi:murein DD-endopeptidase MepM/ murein hydrolase activator NlpD